MASLTMTGTGEVVPHPCHSCKVIVPSIGVLVCLRLVGETELEMVLDLEKKAR